MVRSTILSLYHISSSIQYQPLGKPENIRVLWQREIFLPPSRIYARHTCPYINMIQQDATVCRYLFTAKSLCTCFGCPSHPSSGVHKTVTAASEQQPSSNVAKGHVGGRLFLYQRLQLQFNVLLMMGAMDTRNM